MSIVQQVSISLAFLFLWNGSQESTIDKPCDSLNPKSDPYHLKFVQSAFDTFIRFQKHGMFSFEYKRLFIGSPSLPEFGDSITVSVLKLIPLEDLAKKENTLAYINLLIVAFSDRSRVTQKSDQETRVTSLVLEYLRTKAVSNPILQKEIEYTAECTRNFGCTAEAKRYFAVHPDP